MEEFEGWPSPTHFRISSFYQDEDDNEERYPDEGDDGDNILMRMIRVTMVMIRGIFDGWPSNTHFRISSFYQDEDDEYPDEGDDRKS